MNIFNYFKIKLNKLIEDISAEGALPIGMDLSRASVEPPRDSSHGDIATNAAMVLARPAKMKPRDIAELLIDKMRDWEEVSDVGIAGPGFINLKIADDFWRDAIGGLLKQGLDFGSSDIGAGKKVMVEYVSANPTGPLHAAHARGAVVGDALASLLTKAGFDVTREYYVNDAGAQIDVLARSAYLRYREARGDDIGTIPEGFYPGEYLKDVGKAVSARDGGKWMQSPEEEWLPEVRAFAIAMMMEGVKKIWPILALISRSSAQRRHGLRLALSMQ